MMKMASIIMGSDPRVATCRGRLQTRRCQLNQEINKELRLRAGAENLFKATTNRKLRETVALELSFVNSNLQLLKEQLAELNSSVELYQNDSKECVMPMIPLGLKETKEVDFREPFKDFILEHYSEDAAAYEDAISDFMDMRQAMRTPVRSTAGVALLFKYYNQLYFIERRFFPPDRSLGVYFEWFDSLTGVPSCQRTVAFEKACVLFNIAGIYTQIGAKQDRHTCAGLDGAVDALLRAAGTLRYIHENFTNAPSVDLAADTLLVLGTLMTAQARECLLEKLQLQAQAQAQAQAQGSGLALANPDLSSSVLSNPALSNNMLGNNSSMSSGPLSGSGRQMGNVSVPGQGYGRDSGVSQTNRDKVSDMVMITNLPPTVTWQLIREKFSECGDVKFAEMTAPDTAIVRFHKEWDAERAIKMFDRTRIDGRTIDVRFF